MKNTSGLMLALTAAALFAAGPVAAQSVPNKAKEPVKCGGANACRGQSACKTASSACKGQNACKGQGMVLTTNPLHCTGVGGKVMQQ